MQLAAEAHGKIADIDHFLYFAQAFLQAFYTAQRGRLEAQVLLGRRRKDKHDRGTPAAR